MLMFNEKVKVIPSGHDLNFLTVETFQEVFFDVFEITINNNTFITEKVSEYKGLPVVIIPITYLNKKYDASFVLKEGAFEVLFNPKTLTYTGEVPAEEVVVEEIIQDIIEDEDTSINDFIIEERDDIINEITELKQNPLNESTDAIELFNEKVKAIPTEHDLNFLTVETFQEVFFDVLEITINGNTFITEKVSEYKGMPVVTIPITHLNKKYNAPFVLKEGALEVLFNIKNLTYTGEVPAEEVVVEEIIQDIIECKDTSIDDFIIEKRDDIINDINQAKLSATKYAEAIKQQKISEASLDIQAKQVRLKNEIAELKQDLLNEFYSLTENVRSDLNESNNQERNNVLDFINNSLTKLSDKLISDVTLHRTDAIELFDEKIEQLANNILKVNLLKEIEHNQVSNLQSIDEKFKAVTEVLNTFILKEQAQIVNTVTNIVNTKLEEYDANLITLEKVNVEINESVRNLNNFFNDNINTVSTKLTNEINESKSTLKSLITDKFEEYNNSFDIFEKADAEINDSIIYLKDNITDNIKTVTTKFTDELNESKSTLHALITDKFDEYNNSLEIFESADAEINGSIIYLKDTIADNSNKIDTLDVKLTDKINESITSLKDTINDKIDTADIKLTDKINETIIAFQDTINDNTDKIISLDTKFEESNSALDTLISTRIDAATSNIHEFYDNKIQLIEDNVTDITATQKQEFISLINESKQSLLAQIADIKIEHKQILIEQKDSSPLDLKGVKKDLEKDITTRFTNELVNLKRYIELSSGGGSVAQQFANGGTMNGNLVVTGTLSASQYLGITQGGGGVSGDYLPLSGGTVNGNLTVVGTLCATLLEALSANITVLDIKQYELSGFNVQGNATVQGTVSANNTIYGNKITVPANGIINSSEVNGGYIQFVNNLLTTFHNGVVGVSRDDGFICNDARGYSWNNGLTTGDIALRRLNTDTLVIGNRFATETRNLAVSSLSATGDIRVAGNVGIGTSTPSTKLEVVGSVGKFNVSSEGYTTSMTRSNSNLRFTGFNLGIISFAGTADGYTTQQIGAQINSLTDGTGAESWQLRPAANLLFHTTPNLSGAVLTERMRITGAGNVGIGTTAPNERLTVVGNISAAGDIAVATSLQGVILVSPDSTRWKITVNDDGSLQTTAL